MNRHDAFKIDNYKRITRYSLIALALVGVLLFYFLFLFKIPFKITDVIAFVAAGVALFTLINFSRNIDIIQNHHLKSLEINKNQYSFSIIAEGHKDYIARSFEVLRRVDKQHRLAVMTINQLMHYFDENPNDEREVIQILNYFEHISLLIKKNHVDESIIKDSYRSLFIRTHSLTEKYIKKVQTEKSHTIWSEYEKTALKWKTN